MRPNVSSPAWFRCESTPRHQIDMVVRGTILQLATKVSPPAPPIDSAADFFSTRSKTHGMKRKRNSSSCLRLRGTGGRAMPMRGKKHLLVRINTKFARQICRRPAGATPWCLPPGRGQRAVAWSGPYLALVGSNRHRPVAHPRFGGDMGLKSRKPSPSVTGPFGRADVARTTATRATGLD